MSVVTQTQIANRALMKVGSLRIAAGAFLTENSLPADTLRACYDIVRRAELERNVWRFSIRTIAIRALNPDLQNITFPAWAVSTTYTQNDVVTGSDGQIYVSLIAANLGNDPISTTAKWTLYFGPLIAVPFARAFAIGTTYGAGDIVIGSDNQTYKSKAGANVGHDPTTDGGVHWTLDKNNINAGLSFFAGEIVFTGGAIYLSLISNNLTDPVTDTTGSWLLFTAQPTLSKVNFIYPIGAGPSTERQTRNVFIFPAGFLRKAAQDPKAAQNAFLGGPAGLRYDDWYFENNCFTSFDVGPTIFRFAADVSDTMQFSPLFVEGFACRLALEICEPLTQSDSKLAGIEQEYRKFMGEARTVNGIEVGSEDPPLDEYLAVRV